MALLIVAPGTNLWRTQEAESCESEVPVEECIDPVEIDLTGRAPSFRRHHARTARTVACIRRERRELYRHCVPESPPLARTGHTLANGLRAPPRC